MSPAEDRGPVAVRAAAGQDIADERRAEQIASDCAEEPVDSWRATWWWMCSGVLVLTWQLRRAVLPAAPALDGALLIAILSSFPVLLAVLVRGGIADRVRTALRKRGATQAPASAATPGEATRPIGIGWAASKRHSVLAGAIFGPMLLIWSLDVTVVARGFIEYGGLAVTLLVLVALAWRNGRMTVYWPRPPVCGDVSARFHLSVSEGGARVDQLRCVLVCVRRRTSRFGFEDSWEAIGAGPEPAETTAWVGPGSDVVLDVPVPAELPPSGPAGAPDAVVWKLRVSGVCGTAPFVARFEVPMLAPQGPGVADATGATTRESA